MSNSIIKFAYKDMKVNQSIINRGTGEIVRCLRQHTGMTVIDTTALTPANEKSLLNAFPDTIIVDPLA